MLTIYCYAKCSTCKKALAWLDARGEKYTLLDIKTQHPDETTLRDLYAKSDLPLKRFFNTSGILYRENDFAHKLPSMSESAQIALLASDGMLVKRPLFVLERDGKTTVIPGFKEAAWKKCLE